MSDAIVIEPATADRHLSEIEQLAGTIWREHYPGIISHEQIEYMLRKGYALDELRRDLTQRRIHYDRALIGGRLVGFSAYGPHSDPDALMLHKLYVSAEQRGRGCARRLVETAAAYARSQSLDCIVLRVNKANRIAIAAYERMGFASQGPIVSDIGAGFVMDDYLLKLAL